MGWENFTKEQRRKYDHERYMADHERRLAMAAKYREEHREELAAKARERYKQKVLSRWERNT